MEYWARHMNDIMADLRYQRNRGEVEEALKDLDSDVIYIGADPSIDALKRLEKLDEIDIIEKWLLPYMDGEPKILYEGCTMVPSY